MTTAPATAAAELEGASLVRAKLHRAWHKERRFQHSRGLCYFLLWLVALILLDLFVDWLFLIPGAGRLALLGINVAALGWVIYRHWLRYLKSYDPVRTALQVEGRHPELQSLLVSFVQLSGEAVEGAYASPSLIRALQRQAIETTRPLNFREIVSFAELKRIFVLSLCVVGFFAIYTVNWSDHLRVLAYRMLNPDARLRYPTRTIIAWIPGNVSARQGDEVTLQVVASKDSLIPKQGTLYVKPENGTWEKLVLPRTDGHTFAYRFPEVFQSFAYRVRLGDASSEKFDVTVIPPPRIVGTQVHLRYPAYTGLSPRDVDILNLEVPQGTELEWELRCDQALALAEMFRDEKMEAPIPLTLAADGHVARYATTATESFAYQFRWKEQAHGYVYNEDVHYFIQVVPDTAPQVEIVRPLEDEKATVRKTLTVAFQARDDYGLAEAWIIYSLNEGEEKKHAVGPLKGRLVDHEAPWRLKDTLPEVKEGDVLTYAIEVRDNHTGDDGPFVSRSQTRRLYIVSIEEYLRYMAEQRRKLVGEIRSLHEQETEASEKVGEIKTRKPD